MKSGDSRVALAFCIKEHRSLLEYNAVRKSMKLKLTRGVTTENRELLLRLQELLLRLQ